MYGGCFFSLLGPSSCLDLYWIDSHPRHPSAGFVWWTSVYLFALRLLGTLASSAGPLTEATENAGPLHPRPAEATRPLPPTGRCASSGEEVLLSTTSWSPSGSCPGRSCSAILQAGEILPCGGHLILRGVEILYQPLDGAELVKGFVYSHRVRREIDAKYTVA